MTSRYCPIFVHAMAALFILVSSTSFASGPQEKLLYSFQGPAASNGQDGEAPGALVSDGKGNFYGVTNWGGICLQAHYASYQCGTVFELSPPATAGGAWTETVIYEFGTNSLDGQGPQGNLIRDKQGNLYGTTFASGGGDSGNYGCGNFFELSPPAEAGGAWTETILYNFQGNNDGCGPLGTLVTDSKGNIFGATVSGGSQYAVAPKGYNDGGVFEMSPPSSTGGLWTETFTQANGVVAFPAGGITIDNKGNLYGGTYYAGTGTIFQLIPPATPGGTFTGTTLYTFLGGSDGSAAGGLTIDSKGNLYGVTQNGGSASYGTAFELSPPPSGTIWTKKILYSFKSGTDGNAPVGQMTFDVAGNLYGTTLGGGTNASLCSVYQGCGTVFKLTHGTTGWSERVLHRFLGPYSDGSYPTSSLVVSGPKIYGTTPSGGTVSPTDYGTAFEITQ